MIMDEIVNETSNRNPRRRYRKHRDNTNDISSIYSSKNSSNSSMTYANDWHRLLLTRLKPTLPNKYQTARSDDSRSDSYSSNSFEDSNLTSQLYNDESTVLDNHQIVLNEFDSSTKQLSNSLRRDSHYVKNCTVNRSTDHITSLKRRVRKQQMRHIQNQPLIFQETSYQLPTPTNLFLVSYPEQTVLPRRYRQKKSTCTVSLPPLINSTRMIPMHMHGLKLNLYGY